MAGFLARVRESLFGQQRANGLRVNWPAGPSFGSGDIGPPGEWQMRSRSVGDEHLLSFSAVYAAVQIISGDAAKLPVVFYDIAPDGTKTVNTSYPLNAVMRRPNRYQNRMQFMQAVLISYLTTGNAYIYKVYDNRNLVREMHVLDPRAVWPYIGEDGSVYYRTAPNMLAGIKATEMLPARFVGHIRLQFSSAYPLMGVSPIYAAAASSATGQRILFNAQKFFGNAARPGGVLEAPARVSEDGAKRMTNDWDQNYGPNGQGKTAFLTEGVTFKQMTMSAIDAQLIEQLRWSVEDVARCFRVPPFMIGDQSKTTYRNSEQLARTYLNGCLDYHLSGITNEFDAMFELGSSMTMAFDLDFLLRTEIDLRYEAYGKGINAGWLRINEVRKKEGLAPDEYGDDLIAQGAMRTLEDIIEGVEPPPAAPPANPETDKPKPEEPETEEPEEQENSFASAYKGVWDSADYARGNIVTHGGALWMALRATSQKPGTLGADVMDWRLIVKSGAAGKPGKTPRLSVDPQGIVRAHVDGEEPAVIGDMRPLFQEVVNQALKDAKVTP